MAKNQDRIFICIACQRLTSPSCRVAASSSFAASAGGAALPLATFLFGHGEALSASIALTALGLSAPA